MRNRLTDLNNHLFASLERLNDEDLTEEQLAMEAERAKQVANVAGKVLEVGKLALSAARFASESGDPNASLPDMLSAPPALPDARAANGNGAGGGA